MELEISIIAPLLKSRTLLLGTCHIFPDTFKFYVQMNSSAKFRYMKISGQNKFKTTCSWSSQSLEFVVAVYGKQHYDQHILNSISLSLNCI